MSDEIPAENRMALAAPPEDKRLSDTGELRAALNEAINQAKAERNRPLRRERFRTELIRLIKIYACLYALEHAQTENIDIRRDLEKLESTVFINRKSVDVEGSRGRVMAHREEVWLQIEAVMDLLRKDER